MRAVGFFSEPAVAAGCLTACRLGLAKETATAWASTEGAVARETNQVRVYVVDDLLTCVGRYACGNEPVDDVCISFEPLFFFRLNLFGTHEQIGSFKRTGTLWTFDFGTFLATGTLLRLDFFPLFTI